MTGFHLNASANGSAVDVHQARAAFDEFLEKIKALGADRVTVSGSFTSTPDQLGKENVSGDDIKAHQAP